MRVARKHNGARPESAPAAARQSWYALNPEAVAQQFGVDPTRGLAASDALARLAQSGPNSLPEPPRPSALARLLRQFQSPLIYLLIAAAAIAFALGEHVDTAVIVGVLIVNALLGALQEGRAEQAMEALARMTRHRVRVVRDGVETELEAEALVPGDVLALAAGDAIAADARVLESVSLETSESALTGESTTVAKRAEPVDAGAPLGDRASMVFAGTHVTAGRGRALVVATGVDSEFGRIAELTTGAPRVRTPLELRMQRFGRSLLALALAVFAVVLLVGWLRDVPPGELWMVAISQLVSVVPEGLPVALTVALAVGMQRMAARRAIVRRLAAVETLGSTSVICSDKTGTLTRNEMTVTALVLPGGREVEVTGIGYAPEGRFLEAGRELALEDDRALGELLEAVVLCNDAHVAPAGAGDPRWVALGDPTEAALVTLARKAGLDADELRAQHPRTSEVPFESTARRMATEHRGAHTIVKGAPEVVLESCEDAPRAWLDAADALAARGLRVLAIAQAERPLSEDGDRIGAGLRMLGLVGELDPPREEAREALRTCESAGLRTLMVTGDHRRTAAAVAESLGMLAPGARVIDGVELDRMPESELERACDEVRVFARVQPVHKLRLVEALQRRGAVVAMTGDGVNDAPALVRADVGVAMGLTGTEVARQAADIVVTDDNFATIVHAVEEGRLVHRNLQKVVLLLLSTSLAEVLVLLAALLFGLPLPFAAVQILWNNVVTEGAITINLAMEPREGDEMRRGPLPRGEALLSRSLLLRLVPMSLTIAALVIGWFVAGLAAGRDFATVQTGAFMLLAVCEWFNLLNCRSERFSALHNHLRGNPWLLAGLGASIALQFAVVYVPFANAIFRTTPLALTELAWIVALGSTVLWVEELRKLLARRKVAR